MIFPLAISCLTTSNLPWFTDLIFQVPMQYFSLQHRTLLSSPDTSTTGCCFCFGSISSFFLELFLHSSPIAYWAPYQPGEFIFQCPIFWLFILFTGFSRQECWSGLLFPCPLDHVFSKLSTMTHLSWVVPHSMAHSFIKLEKAVIHVVSLVSFLWLWLSVIFIYIPQKNLFSKVYNSVYFSNSHKVVQLLRLSYYNHHKKEPPYPLAIQSRFPFPTPLYPWQSQIYYLSLDFLILDILY